MMYRQDNGKLKFYRHQCQGMQQGQIMTPEELHDFTVEILMKEYAETGAAVGRYDKTCPSQADFWFQSSGKKPCFISGNEKENIVNVMVVCRNETSNDIAGIDTSWMVDEYRRTGAIPRVTFAKYFCIFNRKQQHDIPKRGGDFAFMYRSISLIPDEVNEPLEKILTAVELADLYSKAWTHHDPSFIEPFLDKDYHYTTDLVFDELPSRAEFLYYFRSKMKGFKEEGITFRTRVGRDKQNDEVAALIYTEHSITAIRLNTRDGRILSGYAMEYDNRFDIIDPSDELYQVHGDHIDALMGDDTLMGSDTLSTLISNSTLWRKTITEYTNENLRDHLTKVFSLNYGQSPISMMTIIANALSVPENRCVTVYPLMQGTTHSVQIDKVLEWDNSLEATIRCTIGERTFHFFATDYYANKPLYKVGAILNIQLAALGMHIEKGATEISIKGEQALAILKNPGDTPKYDEQGNLEPLTLNMKTLSAYLNLDSKCPDEAFFQSPTTTFRQTSFMDIDYLYTDIIISRNDGNDIAIPLYFRKNLMHEFKAGAPISGTLWLTGSIDGLHERAEYTQEDIDIGKECALFRDFMKMQNFDQFDNLTHLLPAFSKLKIRDGYELDAFETGIKRFGWEFQAYCCKVGSTTHYQPIEDEQPQDDNSSYIEEVYPPYDDSMYIEGVTPLNVASKIPSPLEYFEVPFTHEGILQAWFLHNLHEFMPRYWHGNYKCKKFIFTEKDLKSSKKHAKYREDCPYTMTKKDCEKLLALTIEPLLPTIEIDGDSATITYTYWNNWSGMVSVIARAYKDGKSIKFSNLSKNVIVKYKCGMRF